MNEPFIGRRRELALLDKRLTRIRTTGTGCALAVRGRHQVGKSRLAQEFCTRAGVPYLYATATRGASVAQATSTLLTELRDSTLPAEPDLMPEQGATGWPDTFRILAAALPDTPSIVVLDELPWLSEQDEVFDGALQTAWDRNLAGKPVLLLLLGSDLHMMERLTAYDRPFYGRADNLVLGPLNPAETGRALGLAPADALDAHLVSGGLPGILRGWPHATPAMEFLRTECDDPSSPVFGVPETTLLAELPNPDAARRVLEAVGSGDRTHANIAATAGSRAGALASGTLTPLLHRLTEQKRLLAVDQPLSTRAGKPALHRVADSNLRLYFAALRSAHQLTRRGQSQGAHRLIQRRWPTWRGRAVEPLVRQALELAATAGSLPWPDTEAVGGWWNRRFDPEVDLVGADRAPVARRVHFAGSIKWLESRFDAHDLAALQRGAAQIPGFTPGETGLVVVSLSGVDPALGTAGLDIAWTARDVIDAWAG